VFRTTPDFCMNRTSRDDLQLAEDAAPRLEGIKPIVKAWPACEAPALDPEILHRKPALPDAQLERRLAPLPEGVSR
jgi:hypothetical protein